MRWLGHELRAEVKQAGARAPSRIEVEVAGFRAFFAFIERHRQTYRIVKQAETVDPAVYREYYERFAEGYRDAIAAAAAREEYAPYQHPEAVAYMLMGLGDFLGMRYLLWQEGPVPDAVFADLALFLRRALLARPDDGATAGAGGRLAPAGAASGAPPTAGDDTE